MQVIFDDDTKIPKQLLSFFNVSRFIRFILNENLMVITIWKWYLFCGFVMQRNVRVVKMFLLFETLLVNASLKMHVLITSV